MSGGTIAKPPEWRTTASLWTAFVALDTGTQIAFKWGAGPLSGLDFGWPLIAQALSTPGVLIAAAGYTATFWVWVRILNTMPLSRAFPITGLAYVTVPLLAAAIFGEAIDMTQAAGIALIVAGVLALGSVG